VCLLQKLFYNDLVSTCNPFQEIGSQSCLFKVPVQAAYLTRKSASSAASKDALAHGHLSAAILGAAALALSLSKSYDSGNFGYADMISEPGAVRGKTLMRASSQPFNTFTQAIHVQDIHVQANILPQPRLTG